MLINHPQVDYFTGNIAIRKIDETTIQVATSDDYISVIERITYVGLACIAVVFTSGLALCSSKICRWWDQGVSGYKSTWIIHLSTNAPDTLHRKLSAISSSFFSDSDELDESASIWLRKQVYLSKKNSIINDIHQKRLNLNHIDNIFKNDQEIMLEAVKQQGINFLYASSNLQNSRDFALKAVNCNGTALFALNHDLQDDPEIAIAAVLQIRSIPRFSNKTLNEIVSVCYKYKTMQQRQDLLILLNKILRVH